MIRIAVLLLICLLSVSNPAWSQDRYMVFFTDKAESPFSISNPAAFLSQRAIQRRQRQGLAIKEQDLPVSENYVRTLTGLGATCFYRTKWMNGVLVQMEESLLADVRALDFVREVEYVAPGATLDHQSSGGDGVESSFAFKAESDFQNQMLGIDHMHDDGYRGEGLLIGVFDEGFSRLSDHTAFEHLFADDRILYTFDYTANEENVENTVLTHGTRVLSTLAANEPGQLVGAAPEASYILTITEDAGEYRVEEYNWLFAAEKADSAGVDIINTSLGYNVFNDAGMDYTQADMDGQTTVITRAVNMAFERGILLLTSAGNTGLDLEWNIIRAPADSPHILAVGAVNVSGDRARISSRGPTADARVKPDVMALGIATAVIGSNGTVTFSDGTSFASPLVAGLAAGLWQAFPDLTAAQLLSLIRQSGDNYNSPDNELGYGIPSYVTALQLADEINLPVAPRLLAYPNPIVDGVVNLAFESSFFDQPVTVVAHDANGLKLQTYQLSPTARDNRMSLDLGEVPAGVYLLRITGAGGTLSKRIVKF